MKYTHVIWDFNGTVLNDVDAGIRAVNVLLAARGLPTLADADAYRRVFHFPIKSYYQTLGFDFEREPYEELAPQWVALYLQYSADAPLCPNVNETLAALRARGLSQTLLSATEQGMLRSQVNALGLDGYFDEMLGLDHIHAHSKLALARAWREAHPHVKAFMIGDTEHDFEAAEAMHMDCFLIAGGHQPRETLLGTGALVFDSLQEAYAYWLREKLI